MLNYMVFSVLSIGAHGYGNQGVERLVAMGDPVRHFWVLGGPLWKDDGMGAGSLHSTTEGRYLILVPEGLPLTTLVEG